jgi:hypothetical protein
MLPSDVAEDRTSPDPRPVNIATIEPTPFAIEQRSGAATASRT